jgi:hypothetical protein
VKQIDLIRTIEIKDRTGRVVGTKEVVTYPGLLSKAHEEGLQRVATKLLQIPSDENGRMAIAKALVVTTKGRFEGIGDACPDNVNSFIVPHLIRMAETRAKARALRDAVNIGIVSFEELDGDGLVPNGSDLGSGAPPAPARPARGDARPSRPAPKPGSNGDEALMTEAQRRYLFRLMAGQGLEGEAAQELLKEHLDVSSLKEVTKTQATRAIDRLLKEVSDGAAQR